MREFHPIKGQAVSSDKVQRSRELRREMTPEERILWRELRGFRTHGYPFRRQQIVAGFIVDFYCHQASLVVEVDGGVHQEQTEYDAERDTLMSPYGLRILRIPNDDIHRRLPAVIHCISAALPIPPLPAGEGVRG